jgi:hypothetical protein
MQSSTSRAGRWPIALTILGVAALSACSDDPASPKQPSVTAPAADVAPATLQLKVTNASGGTEVGSLRWAASQFRDPENAIITFDSTLSGATIELGDQLYLTGYASIQAPKGGITLSGKGQHRVILALQGVRLENMTVANGNASTASAIWSGGKVSLNYSTVRDNSGTGPVIDVEGLGFFMNNSTISRNVGSAAVEYEDSSRVSLDNSAIAFNTPGAGLRYEGGSSTNTRVDLYNSIISNNGSPQRNCTSTFGFYYHGTNISNDASCGTTSVLVADPKLMALANNGGPNMTHAIPHTSPAFNSGFDCGFPDDQRHVMRDAKCDAGPFEFNDFTKVTLTIDPGSKIDASGNAILTGTIKCTRNDYFRLALELHQDQKVGKEIVDVHSATDIWVDCKTATAPWSAAMVLVDGEAFQAGAARAMAGTFQTPEWVTPANATGNVKISFGRK